MRLTGRIRTPLLALWALGLSACATSPPTRFLTLDPTPAGAAPTPAYAGPPLRVREAHVPDALDRAEVALETRPGVMSVDDFAHWAAPLGRLVRAALAEDLAGRLPAGAVVTPEEPLPPGGCDLVADILAFNVEDGRARLEVSWALLGPSGASRTSPIEILEGPAPGRGAQAVAAGLSALLGSLSSKIAAELTAPPEGGLCQGPAAVAPRPAGARS